MSAAPDTVLIAFVTCPPAAAAALADALVTERVTACVNLLPSVRSVYRWKDAIERGDECLLLAKTTRARYSAFEAAVRAHHPYELPEIIAVDIACGLPDYLQWVRACVD
jgi:periplasmic divalent cation tolerance protein